MHNILAMQDLTRLIAVQVEVTEGLIDNASSSHALNLLGNHAHCNTNVGKMDDDSAAQYSGTYSKQC